MKKVLLIFVSFLSLCIISCAPKTYLKEDISEIKPIATEEAEGSKQEAEGNGQVAEDSGQVAEDSSKQEAVGSKQETVGSKQETVGQAYPEPEAESDVSDIPEGTDSESESDPEQGEQEDYKIGSGDVLEIITWKEPDFSRELLVRIDGKITFPLLDDIQAADRTPMEVKKDIEKGLKEFIEHPFVTITVKSYASESYRYYILGEVSKTGAYDLVEDLTVLQAFALAGGFTEWASKKEIIVIRHENGQKNILRVNYKNIVKGKDLDQNILIKPNDTIIVP
ncbi:polysaccharide biosynthesis/export family protein [Desulfococcaceae bacterium HSG8]|nr:polysaccharide biosynthesis/export family protein [Desulfococcaceae bacterium HSG8]